MRELRRTDLQSLSVVLDQTGLFPSDLLPSMAEPYLSGTAPHHWLVALEGIRPIGFAYAEPERMTDGTFNLLAIAVLPQLQGSGVGKAIVADLIKRLLSQGGRVLLVETSSLEEYAATRAFYDNQGFSREAQIRDFYAAGEDKLIFWKGL